MPRSESHSRSERRVYVRRRSRTTVAQARALEDLDCFLLTTGAVDQAFGRLAPLMVEIGFGNGDALAQFALANPNWNCIGVEVFRPGMGALINACQEHELENVRIVDGEGLTFLESLDDESLDLIWVLFPDPWPKARHHKRRLVTEEFGEVVAKKLKSTGKLAIATDWAPYAEYIEESLGQVAHLQGGIVPKNHARTTTKYEQRGQRLGHQVTDFEYQPSN